MFNPLHVPFNSFDICITQAEYDAIFVHDLGADCIADSGDEPHSEANPEITRVAGAAMCPDSDNFDADACACEAET